MMHRAALLLGIFALCHAPPSSAQTPRIRKLTSTHLTLHTDLPPSREIDQLPRIFDAAVPQWASYFGVPQAKVADWHVEGYLIRDRQNFAARGLMPEENPDFVNGFARAGKLWLVEQPSDYYRRHLLLHEGTHAFMYAHLDARGPGWYMEGLAELLGTHRWEGERLTLRQMPGSRKAVPMWGRIKLIREAVRDAKQLNLSAVMAIDKRRRWSTEAYAWTWALASFLDSHPHYQEPFRQLAAGEIDQKLNKRFRKQFAEQWSDLRVEWEAYVATLQYGYDSARMAMQHKAAAPVEKLGASTAVAADRGWQSTGWRLEAGRRYEISATGRYQIAIDSAGPWPCEPGGVTLEYHEGKPLGVLLGAFRPSAAGPSFGQPITIGLRSTLIPQQDAVLYLRVNDSPARLSDNQGELRVQIEARPLETDGD